MNLTSQMEHPCCRSLLWLLFPSFFPYTLLLSSAFFAQSSRCFSSISFILHALQVALGRNQPLKRERPKWKSDYPMTEGQLRSKRDEFWDTAPAFEGRKEIWDALRAAASAFESNDHLLAQAILDGASITLPHGKNTCINKYGFLHFVLLLVPLGGSTMLQLMIISSRIWTPPAPVSCESSQRQLSRMSLCLSWFCF